MRLNVIFPRKRGKIEKIIILGPLEKPIKNMRQFQLLTFPLAALASVEA
jgi:hypothetical protein